MYVPEHFVMSDRGEIEELIRSHSFATLVSTGDDGVPVASHIPLVLDGGVDGRLLGHFARANPHWKLIDGVRSMLAVFLADHAYISPRWYPSFQREGKQVPTWNYRAVHITGIPNILSERAEQDALLEALAHENEGEGGYKPADTNPRLYETLSRGIISFELPINQLEAKAKLIQNKSQEDRDGVSAHLPDLVRDPG